MKIQKPGNRVKKNSHPIIIRPSKLYFIPPNNFIGFKLILEARERAKKLKDPTLIRALNPASNEVNFDAIDLMSLIKWKPEITFEPSLTFKIDTVDISSFTEMENPPRFIFDFPCHTQGTERYIPLIADSVNKVGDKEREGYILAKLAARDLNPSFSSKSSYNI